LSGCVEEAEGVGFVADPLGRVSVCYGREFGRAVAPVHAIARAASAHVAAHSGVMLQRIPSLMLVVTMLLTLLLPMLLLAHAAAHAQSE